MNPGSNEEHELKYWQPENEDFWSSQGQQIANRNLWISIPALLFSFSIWLIWSAVAIQLNNIGFNFSTNQLFWLTALPGLSGAVLRMIYSFIIPIFGGRKWTTISTLSLLIPCFWLGIAVQDTSTSYSTFIIIALLCGLGGGNFASSMANISFFFPKHQQGTALGLNAGLGNLGVSLMQFVIPVVITINIFGGLSGEPQMLNAEDIDNSKKIWLQNAGFIWIPCILLCALASWYGMDDIKDIHSSIKEQFGIFKSKHNWLVCWLYTATFGSFIGYAASFPMLINTQFPHVNALQFAFLGPLVGALLRPVGGWMADKMGSAKVSFWNFSLMIGAVFGVLYYLPNAHYSGDFYGFLSMFTILFITTGIGNGAIFSLIPAIYQCLHLKNIKDTESAGYQKALKEAHKQSATVLGFSSAVAAFGAFFIPTSYGTSIDFTGSPKLALGIFIIFYLSCLFITWWWYHREGAEVKCDEI